MPTVSILVPVYKAEKTLDACVESILAQSYADFELLLIDDASPDHCPEMCDAWAEKDPRIRALHPAKTGPGPSGARNTGLDAAKGQWLTMVDSDDTVAPRPAGKAAGGCGKERRGAGALQLLPRVTEDGRRAPIARGRTVCKRDRSGRERFLGCLQHALGQPVHRHGPPAVRRQAV